MKRVCGVQTGAELTSKVQFQKQRMKMKERLL